MARGFVQMRLVGARELDRNLRTLPKRLARNTLLRALTKAAQPIADDARSRAEAIKATGKNASKIEVSNKLSRRQRAGARRKLPGEVIVYIGVRPSPVAHLIEFGTGPRYTTGGGDARRGRGKKAARGGGGGAYRGQMKPQPFMRPAWDTKHRAALDEFGRILGQEIEATAKRLARREARGTRGRS